MSRTLPLVAVALVALIFLVAPSIARLAFLMDPPAATEHTEPTDVAFADHRATGLLHIVPGLVMVALWPVQLSGRIRRRWPALHRVCGRIVVLAGVLVCGTALWMNVVFPVVGGWAKLTVISAMSVAELLALTLAMRAIWVRDVARHRRWMIRAIGVALSAGSAGLFVVPFYAAGAMSDTVVGVGRWLGFLTTMFAVELWLRRTSAREAAA